MGTVGHIFVPQIEGQEPRFMVVKLGLPSGNVNVPETGPIELPIFSKEGVPKDWTWRLK